MRAGGRRFEATWRLAVLSRSWLAGLALLLAPGALAQLSLSPQPDRTVKPGGLEPVVFTVANSGTAPLEVGFAVDAPAGVSVLVPPSDLDLAPGTTALVAATLALDATLPAGRYEVRLSASAGTAGATAAAGLVVQPAPGLRVTGPPTVSPGPFTVSVSNTGNQPDAVTVTARGTAGTVVTPALFPAFQLAPGESRSLEFTTVVAVPSAVFVTASGSSGALGGYNGNALPDASLPPPPFLWYGRLAASGPANPGLSLALAGAVSDTLDSSFSVAWSPALTAFQASLASGGFSVSGGFLSDSTALTAAPVYGWGGRAVWTSAPVTLDLAVTDQATTASVALESSFARGGASGQWGPDGFSAQVAGGVSGNPNASARVAYRPVGGLSWTASAQYSPQPGALDAALGLPAGTVGAASLSAGAT
ncbi:MAG TPA: hypothetical protein VHN99_02800, partial [Deinococcales bacterium]|nr:hypothetical protein [Deinococcales bacterium]